MTTIPVNPDTKRPEPHRRLLGPGFWLSITLGLLCVIGGAMIALYAPTLLSSPRTSIPTETFGSVARSVSKPPPVPMALQGQPSVNLDGTQQVIAKAIELVSVTTKMSRNGRTTRSFRSDWNRLNQLAPGNSDVSALRELASDGAPSRVALALEFPAYAAKVSASAKVAPPGAGLWSRLTAAFQKIVTVRRTDVLAGKSLDATLARAEVGLRDGDLESALQSLETLDAAPRVALDPWLARARARIEIDRHLAALQDHAALDLIHLTGTAQ